MSTTIQETDEVIETNPWYMAGTEGTGKYNVVAESSFGRFGVRDLGDSVRIRLEPSDEAHAAKLAEVLTREADWKQPGDASQDRFSIVVRKDDEGRAAFERAFSLIKRGRPLTYNQLALEHVGDFWS